MWSSKTHSFNSNMKYTPLFPLKQVLGKTLYIHDIIPMTNPQQIPGDGETRFHSECVGDVNE